MIYAYTLLSFIVLMGFGIDLRGGVGKNKNH